MKLYYKIPLITGFTLILTVFVNLFAFQYFTESLLSEYLIESSKLEGNNSDPEKLQALIRIGTLDPDMQREYAAIIDELSNLSSSLQNIGSNPELYIGAATGSSSEVFTINIGTGNITNTSRNILETFANPQSFDRSSAEGRFILSLLNRLLIVNIIWLICIVSLYFLWTKKLFSPILIITKRLQGFIDTSLFQVIPYNRNDEFFPLVSTINNLHKSLALQENIRSNFLSDLSHEIRTPITAVKLYLEAIEDGVMKLDTKTVGLLQTELSRLATITGKIMEYENLAHDMIKDVNVERFSYKKALSDLREEYLPQLQKKKQDIKFELPNDTMIRMDHGMCLQMIHNLFSNFIKYAGGNSQLICRYEKSSTKYQLEFCDNGLGIPDEEIPLVKEKFYRVDKGRSRNETLSMGIGLSIVERIARIHGGNLEVKKNNPTGICIIVTIKR